ncbi:MAG: cytochrome P460 family protein [Bryobacteraceae bacterium]
MRLIALCLVIACSILAQSRAPGPPPPAGMTLPQYTAAGELTRPRSTQTWTFVGASIGLSYSEAPSRKPPGLIHNVHMQPEAYKYYLETGKFPEKTMLILSLYEPEQKVSPNLHGHFQGKLVATEVALKDTARFKEGWAYFDFSGGSNLKESAKAMPRERCHQCHSDNAADDNVFVQFYPVLRK